MRSIQNRFKKARHITKNIIFATVGLCAIIGGILLIWVSSIQLPDFSSFDSRKVVESTKIYDRTGEVVLYDLNTDVRRTRIPYTEMGTNIKNATVAIEDSQFYQHHGIRIKSIGRALIVNILPSALVKLTPWIDATQGGSTISQQAIKKSLLSDEKTLVRKLKELVLTLKLEREYSKDEILGIYLNEIPYGGNIYGISEAAKTFFNKNPQDISIAEAAYLASIPNAPTRYSPYGPNKDSLETRKNLVLSRMRDLGFITEQEYTKAKSEVVVWQPQQSRGIKAPHFVFFIKDYLEQKYGADVVESGGLKVTTTLDYDLQKAAEAAVYEYTLGDKKQIEDENAGFIAIDPKTGQILTMVGSRDYFDKNIDGAFNVTLAKRQPGSSFKPFMYVTAFEMGYTPETVLFDVPTEFNSNCSPYHKAYPGTKQEDCYMPVNYDNAYHGPMTIREALGRSMNIPAVKMLYMVGLKNALKTAQDMGITTLTDPNRYGLALVLGGGEVKLLEMVSAYGSFATGGTRHQYTPILSVEDKNGNTLESYTDKANEVLPRNATLQISDILSDNVARTPTFGANSALYFKDRQVAVKTGTTNDYKDSWVIGYTPSLVAGVWLGKNDNTPRPVNANSTRLWRMFMDEALKKYPVESFDKPDPDPDYQKLPPILRGFFEGGESFTIDSISKKLATALTPKETREEKVLTDVHSILYWVKKDSPRSGRPTNPKNDPLFDNFEAAVRDWWVTNAYKYPIITLDQKPKDFDDLHTEANAPKLQITSLNPSIPVGKNTKVTVRVVSSGVFPLKKIDVFLNNTYVGAASGSSPSLTFTPVNIDGFTLGENTVMVVGVDTIYNSATIKTSLTITE